MDIDHLTLAQIVAAIQQAAKNCQCEGTRETIFTSRGRDNIVPCLQCEPLYQALEHLEAAAAILKGI
ncbi:MAG: hypothetical protein ACOZF2_18820 [Thermodesulfobacteriota bacterium]